MKTGKSLQQHNHSHPLPPPSTHHGTGSGGSPSHNHSGPNHTHSGSSLSGSSSMYMYKANIIISVDHEGSVDILKNRHGTHGENQPLDKTIDTVSDILTTSIFKGSLDMFQEGLKIKLVEVITKTIKEERGDLFEDSV